MMLFNEMQIPPDKIITAGGGTKNLTWMQIICDMLGMEITIPEPYQCSPYGDAMMAAIGIGKIRDFHELQETLPKGNILKPDMVRHQIYKRNYPLFLQLYKNNKDTLHNLSRQQSNLN